MTTVRALATTAVRRPAARLACTWRSRALAVNHTDCLPRLSRPAARSARPALHMRSLAAWRGSRQESAAPGACKVPQRARRRSRTWGGAPGPRRAARRRPSSPAREATSHNVGEAVLHGRVASRLRRPGVLSESCRAAFARRRVRQTRPARTPARLGSRLAAGFARHLSADHSARASPARQGVPKARRAARRAPSAQGSVAAPIKGCRHTPELVCADIGGQRGVARTRRRAPQARPRRPIRAARAVRTHLRPARQSTASKFPRDGARWDARPQRGKPRPQPGAPGARNPAPRCGRRSGASAQVQRGKQGGRRKAPTVWPALARPRRGRELR